MLFLKLKIKDEIYLFNSKLLARCRIKIQFCVKLETNTHRFHFQLKLDNFCSCSTFENNWNQQPNVCSFPLTGGTLFLRRNPALVEGDIKRVKLYISTAPRLFPLLPKLCCRAEQKIERKAPSPGHALAFKGRENIIQVSFGSSGSFFQ